MADLSKSTLSALVVGEAADFANERDKAEHADDQQPIGAMDGIEQTLGKDHAHDNPD